MANIRVDLTHTIYDGEEIKFRTPVDCSQITGLIVYYHEYGSQTSKVFKLTDAHGNNVGEVDHLFASDVVVKVVLDISTSKAYVQNADTNAYLEDRFSTHLWRENETVNVGDVRYLDGRENSGYVLECVEAGTTGNKQPVFSSADLDNATDLEYFSGTLPIAHGGTGATTVAGARNNLGLGNTTGALPIANGGTGATNSKEAINNLHSVGVFSRSDMGNTVNIDDPNVNGLFEVRGDEIEYTGTLPVKGYYPLLSLKTPDNVAVLQIASASSNSVYVRTSQGAMVSLEGMAWSKLATNGALSMPSSYYVTISANLNQLDYTAPADGWIYSEFQQSADTYAFFENYSKGNFLVAASPFARTANHKTIFVPVSKGDTFKIDRNGATSANDRFYYAQSEV